jgi:hypothetical protein
VVPSHVKIESYEKHEKLDIFYSKIHQLNKKQKKIMQKLGIELSQASLDNSKAASASSVSTSFSLLRD